jgi:hypothetical protein
VLLCEHLRGHWENKILVVALGRGDGVDWPRLGLLNLTLEAFLHGFTLRD